MRMQGVCERALLTGGLLCFLLSVPVYAEGKDGWSDRKERMSAEWKKNEESLGLSPEQKERMKALREQFRSKQDALRTEIKAKQEALRQQLDSVSPDRGKAEALAKEINSLQGQASLVRIDKVFNVREILTPEQFKKLQALHEKRKQMRGEKGVRGEGRERAGHKRKGKGQMHESPVHE